MTQEEIKQFIADKTAEGMSLTAIQDALSAQGVKIRFMELRLLAAEIESVLAKKEADKAAAEAPAPEEKKAEEAPAPAPAESAAPAPVLMILSQIIFNQEPDLMRIVCMN